VKAKRFRRVVRQEAFRAQGQLWEALCVNPWRVRWVLAMRLLFGRAHGVFKKGGGA
jgi:hypothetical protein